MRLQWLTKLLTFYYADLTKYYCIKNSHKSDSHIAAFGAGILTAAIVLGMNKQVLMGKEHNCFLETNASKLNGAIPDIKNESCFGDGSL